MDDEVNAVSAMREKLEEYLATHRGRLKGREREFFNAGWEAAHKASLDALSEPALIEIGAKAALRDELGPDKDVEQAWQLEAAIYIRNARACLAAVIQRVRGT